MNKPKLEELKYGDPLYVQFGHGYDKGKYIGYGLANLNWGCVVSLGDREWFPRVTTWQKIKNYFRK